MLTKFQLYFACGNNYLAKSISSWLALPAVVGSGSVIPSEDLETRRAVIVRTHLCVCVRVSHLSVCWCHTTPLSTSVGGDWCQGVRPCTLCVSFGQGMAQNLVKKLLHQRAGCISSRTALFTEVLR